jgi:hypothetical protein
MTEPRTAAGRALLADVPHRPWRRAEILADILAIEAEAFSKGRSDTLPLEAEASRIDVDQITHCIRQDCDHFDAAECIRALRAEP